MKKKDMIRKIIDVADYFDSNGLEKEADTIDSILDNMISDGDFGDFSKYCKSCGNEHNNNDDYCSNECYKKDILLNKNKEDDVKERSKNWDQETNGIIFAKNIVNHFKEQGATKIADVNYDVDDAPAYDTPQPGRKKCIVCGENPVAEGYDVCSEECYNKDNEREQSAYDEAIGISKEKGTVKCKNCGESWDKETPGYEEAKIEIEKSNGQTSIVCI